jgi:hypothetical protein
MKKLFMADSMDRRSCTPPKGRKTPRKRRREVFAIESNSRLAVSLAPTGEKAGECKGFTLTVVTSSSSPWLSRSR